jgi:hypothetical protein
VTYISQGLEEHVDELRAMAASGRPDLWTLDPRARAGDRIVFYIQRPISGFVALGSVVHGRLIAGSRYGWPGRKMSDVIVDAMVERPLTLAAARQLFGKRWGWLKTPRRTVRVPANIEARFVTAVLRGGSSNGTASAALAEEVAATEGEQSERLIRHRKREVWKRQEKIRAVLAATGCLVCEVPRCGFDFSEVYGPLGHEYAQVHHLKPLSALSGPQETLLKDLSIICANCHAMVHRGGLCRLLKDLIPRRKAGMK